MNKVLSNYLFIYSSLRKGFHNASYNYITRYFSFVSMAKVRGVEKNINGKLFGTPGGSDSYINGELYKLNDEHDFSFVLGQLDDYEGLDVEEGEVPMYRRELTSVYKDDGEVTNAWIYWYNRT
ncbi:MAG TPA: gamma-glutamylcyclotransferase family protein [Ginsengibacter sp.]|nr:gamma-glutamylcyclotransferase family protein [Ginsengibacter sp.]